MEPAPLLLVTIDDLFHVPSSFTSYNSDKKQHGCLLLLEAESSECKLSLGQQSHWMGCRFFLYTPFLNFWVSVFIHSKLPSRAGLDIPVCLFFRYSTIWPLTSFGGSTTDVTELSLGFSVHGSPFTFSEAIHMSKPPVKMVELSFK